MKHASSAKPQPRRKPGAPAHLPMPHERDESTGGAGDLPRPEMRQAQRDLDAGLVDTDLHATPGLDAERRRQLLRRGG